MRLHLYSVHTYRLYMLLNKKGNKVKAINVITQT